MDVLVYVWLSTLALFTFSVAMLMLRVGLNCVRVERKLNREIDAIWGHCDE